MIKAVQEQKPGDVPVVYTDEKGNTWHNVNVFSKQVAADESYPGPLVLKRTVADEKLAAGNHSLVFYSGSDSVNRTARVTRQRPGYIRTEVKTGAAGQITLLQNHYPGWKVYINNKEKPIIEKGRPGITVNIPAGELVIDFRYQRKAVWLSALLVHLLVIGFGILKLREIIKQMLIKSSSLSSPH